MDTNTTPNHEPEAHLPPRVARALREAYAAPEVPEGLGEVLRTEFGRHGGRGREWRGRRLIWASAGMAASVLVGVMVIRVVWPPATVGVSPQPLAMNMPSTGEASARREMAAADAAPSGERTYAAKLAFEGPADGSGGAELGEGVGRPGSSGAPVVAEPGRSLADRSAGRFGSSSVSNVADLMLKAALSRQVGDLDESGSVDVLDAMLLAIRVRDGLAKKEETGGLIEDLNRDDSIDRLDVETILRQVVRVEGAG